MKPALGIFLNLGDSFVAYKKSGRDRHWLNNYLQYYPQKFSPVYVFSYADEINPYPGLIRLLPNRFNLPRWLYTWLIPLFYPKELKQCRVLRVKQMPGIWPALLAKLCWRIPVVATYGYDYAHFAQKEGKWWLAPFFKITGWFGWRFSDAVIVTTPNKNTKARLVPNGADTDLFKPKPHRQGKVIKVLNVGRLVHQKNQLTLVKAMVKLGRPAELTIVGRGPLKPKIMALARKLKVKLKLIGSLGHDRLPRVYQRADIFCLPSHHEGSPKVLLEAMSCGLACVAADKVYSRFIITNGKDGLLAKNTVDNLVLTMNQLIDSLELRQKLGVAARKTIFSRFNNQKIINQELKLLTSFLP